MDTTTPTTAQTPVKTDSEDLSSSYDLESMDPEQREKVEEELKHELSKVGYLSITKYPCTYQRPIINI